ncbi:MAG: hypothetical protein ACREA9_17490 [Pyrinomonadaceae bacterium]
MNPPIPCRGRIALPETIRLESFTAKELDEVAPLSQHDRECLGEAYWYEPRPETIGRVEKRIQVAKGLKYGT